MSICVTCVYYAAFEGICCCGGSQYRGDNPPTDLRACEFHELPKKEVTK